MPILLYHQARSEKPLRFFSFSSEEHGECGLFRMRRWLLWSTLGYSWTEYEFGITESPLQWDSESISTVHARTAKGGRARGRASTCNDFDQLAYDTPKEASMEVGLSMTEVNSRLLDNSGALLRTLPVTPSALRPRHEKFSVLG